MSRRRSEAWSGDRSCRYADVIKVSDNGVST